MSCEQYLIQSFMWKPCVSEDIFRQMAIKCLKVDSNRSQEVTESQLSNEMITQLVSKVNRSIRHLNLQISRGPNETDGTIYYAFINTADNEITRMANQWSQKEILYFRKLLTHIIESRNAFISSTKALNIGREDELKFSITGAEGLINKWVEQKWLEEINEGNVAIGVRTLLEMNVYIREHFEVQDCYRCKALCIRGSNCMSCEIKLHFHCVDSQFIPNNKCPNCSKQWAPSNGQIASTSSTGNSGKILNSNAIPSDDSDEDEELIERGRRHKVYKRSKLM